MTAETSTMRGRAGCLLGVAAAWLSLGVLTAADAAAEPVAVPAPTPYAPLAVTAPLPAAPGALTGSVAPVAAVPAVAPPVPATAGTLAEYFAGKNVTMTPLQAPGFTALDLSLPVPRGWSNIPDPNVPDAFYVIADRSGEDPYYTSNAALSVYRLAGEFDPAEAITHGFIDSGALPQWRTTDASFASEGPFPAARIEGTYRLGDVALNTSRRHVIATTGADRYLVSLTVTTTVAQAIVAGGATDAVVNGFRVSAPAAAPVPAAPAPPPAAVVPVAVTSAN